MDVRENCPECGKKYQEGKVCTKEGRIICIDCCKRCEYHIEMNYTHGHGCSWIDEEKLVSEKEKKRAALEWQIEKRWKLVDYYYKKNMPKVAKRIENEAHRLQDELNNVG